MKQPSLSDRVVRVTAYLTDEAFGYEHWRAAQFSPPMVGKHAALVIFDSADARDAFVATVDVGASGPPRDAE